MPGGCSVDREHPGKHSPNQTTRGSREEEDIVTIRVGINGFGRIGRSFFRAVADTGADMEIVGGHDLTDNETLAQLLTWDTAYAKFPQAVTYDDEHTVVGGKKMRATAEHDPDSLHSTSL